MSALDYILTIGVALPLIGFLLWVGPRILNLVTEMTIVLISSPFM